MENQDKFLNSLDEQLGNAPSIPKGIAKTTEKPDLEPIFKPYTDKIDIGIGDPFQLKKLDTEAAERNKALLDKARTDRINEAAKQFGNTYERNNTEVSDKLGISGQILTGFADNKVQFENAIEKIVGPDNYKVIEDKDATFLQDKYYVSIKKEDGSFTPFTSPTQNTLDYVQKFLPAITYELTTDAAAVGTSLVTSSAASALVSLLPGGVILAPVVGLTSLGYMLYATNKGAERGRQYLQEVFGLREDEAEEFGTFAEELTKIFADPQAGKALKQLLSKQNLIPREQFNQELRGLIGILNLPLTLVDKLKVALGRVRENMSVEDTNIFKSTIEAEKFAEKKGLVPTILPQRTMDKKISRLASLAEQTSVIIPKVLRAQMQSAVNYLKEYTGKIGTGNFNEFRQAMSSMSKMLQNLRSGKTVVDYEGLGVKLNQLEDLFFNLRMDESRGLYKAVFDKVGNSSYNLEAIRNLIVRREAKDTVPVSKQGVGTKKIEAGNVPVVTGQPKVDSIVQDLIALGVTSKGNRVLTSAGIKKAVDRLKKSHPEYAKYLEGNNIVIDTPAKLLHNYAVLLGQMSRGSFARDVGKTPNPELASFTQDLRRTILDTIGKPNDAIDVTKEISTANKFYGETFEKMGTTVQTEARIAAKTGDEPTSILTKLGISPSASGIQERANVTLSNIAFQEDYITKNLKGKANVSGPLNLLQRAFADVLSNKLSGAGTVGVTKIQTAVDVKKYIESFTTRELTNLGITSKIKKELLKDIDAIAKMESRDLPEKFALGNRIKNTELKTIFDSVVSKSDDLGLTQDVDAIINILSRLPKGQQKTAKENIRAGFIDFIFSTQSGVFKKVNENSAYSQVGDMIIDATALDKILTRFNTANMFDGRILTSKDKEIFEGIRNYVAVIKTSGADAGSALAGAQIIGNMFTLDPKKFISGMARLSAQARIAKLFASKQFSDAMTGLGKPQTPASKLKQYFFGAGSIGNMVMGLAMDATGVRSGEAQQTEELVDPGLKKYLDSLDMQTNKALQ